MIEKLKALLHIDEPNKWSIILANTKNFIEDVGLEHVAVEIVVNATAVQIFDSTDKNISQDQQELLKQMKKISHPNITIIVCRNSLKANSINEELLPDFVTVVPAGITRIIIKQREGYSYIKP